MKGWGDIRTTPTVYGIIRQVLSPVWELNIDHSPLTTAIPLARALKHRLLACNPPDASAFRLEVRNIFARTLSYYRAGVNSGIIPKAAQSGMKALSDAWLFDHGQSNDLNTEQELAWWNYLVIESKGQYYITRVMDAYFSEAR